MSGKEMRERIYGTETEYAFQYFTTPAEPARVFRGTEIYLFYLFRRALEAQGYRKLYEDKYNNFSIFLANGARLYVDRGGHPEYATAECRTWRDALVQEKAGERIIAELCPFIERELQTIGYRGNLLIAKNNVDGAGSTYGSHENYLVERRDSEESAAFFARLARHLVPFLVTRQIFCGSGKVDPAVGYQISQRADYISTLFSANTTTKGIINTKEESLAHEQRFRRLHLILGDSNMSDFSLALKLGTTGIVLRLMEDEALKPGLELEDPLLALRVISRDPSCQSRVRLRGGRAWTAIEIQEHYLEAAHRYYATREPDPLEAEILRHWEETLRLLAEDPWQLHRRIDWVIKRWLLERQRQREGLAWPAPQLRQLDIKYHAIYPQGLFARLEQGGWVDRWVEEEEIEQAKYQPPADTRARVRHDFINAVLDNRLEGTATWVTLCWGPELRHSVELWDPFMPFNQAVANIGKQQ
ncbi:MAG: Pup--protein ligase [Nitrospinota bacterium]|nr:MAG: Pup--protein ligase [Nitrospinota bacterium]